MIYKSRTHIIKNGFLHSSFCILHLSLLSHKIRMENPTIHFAHICDTAFLSKDNKLNIIGVFENIYANKFPFHFPRLTVVFNLSAPTGNLPIEIRLMKKGAEKPVLQMQGNIKVTTQKALNVIMDFQNIRFEDQREYNVEILLKNTVMQTLSFSVGLRPKQQA